MRSPSARTRKIIGLSAAPIAIVAAGALVWQGSMAVFTAETRNAGNSWSAGQVTLTDDDRGQAAFNVENLVPGSSGENCITVISNSTVPGEVRSYMENLTDSTSLSEHIDLTIERGTGGGFGNCDGFTVDPAAPSIAAAPLSYLGETRTDFENGGMSWMIDGTGNETAVYRARWTFDTDGMTQQQIDALMGSTTTVDFVWELQSEDPTAEG